MPRPASNTNPLGRRWLIVLQPNHLQKQQWLKAAAMQASRHYLYWAHEQAAAKGIRAQRVTEEGDRTRYFENSAFESH